uniref:U11-Eretoxin-Ek1ap_1 n=1 Tax=Eresus cinnaberinus TaxID=175337 RepID=A0A2D0PDK7_ERECI
MVSHVTSIVSLFALLLGLAECAKCPYAKFTPQHSFCKDPNPKMYYFGTRITNQTDKQTVL